jgi:hypothetical protein
MKNTQRLKEMRKNKRRNTRKLYYAYVLRKMCHAILYGTVLWALYDVFVTKCLTARSTFRNAHFRCKLLCKQNYLHAEDDRVLVEWWPSSHGPPTAMCRWRMEWCMQRRQIRGSTSLLQSFGMLARCRGSVVPSSSRSISPVLVQQHFESLCNVV